MKTKILIIVIIFSNIFFCSCLNKEKSSLIQENQDCLPGYIWINYVGETNKIKKFTLIRTSEKDSTFFHTYFRKETASMHSNPFFEIYCNNYIANTKQFAELKEYIIIHNTHKREEIINIDNYDAIKMVIVDQCDSVEYIVNNEDKGYFSNMIVSLNINDESLKKYLSYYENILN